MSLKKSFAVCLSLLTFAPFSSHAMKESSIELINMSEKSNDEAESSGLLSKEFDSQNMNNFNINESIAQNNSKMSEEEEEAEKLGVRDLTCMICMDDENPDDLLGLKCRHVFHQKCLAEWTRMMEKKSWKCPVCQDILDPVRDALCQSSLEVEDFNTNQTEEENLLNILRNFYIEHPWVIPNDINVFCSTEDIDVGVLYTMGKNRNGEITRIPCVMRKHPLCGVFRVSSARLRARFDALNAQAKSDVKSWNRNKRYLFNQKFYSDFYTYQLLGGIRENRLLPNLRQCAECTGMLLGTTVVTLLLYSVVRGTLNLFVGKGEKNLKYDYESSDSITDESLDSIINEGLYSITSENNQNSNQPN